MFLNSVRPEAIEENSSMFEKTSITTYSPTRATKQMTYAFRNAQYRSRSRSRIDFALVRNLRVLPRPVSVGRPGRVAGPGAERMAPAHAQVPRGHPLRSWPR